MEYADTPEYSKWKTAEMQRITKMITSKQSVGASTWREPEVIMAEQRDARLAKEALKAERKNKRKKRKKKTSN